MKKTTQPLLRTWLTMLPVAPALGCRSSPPEPASFPEPGSSFSHRERASSEAQPEGSAERDATPVDVTTPDDPASPDADGATPLSEEHAAALAAELANEPTGRVGGLHMGGGSGGEYTPGAASALPARVQAMTPGFRRCYKKHGLGVDPEMRGSVILKIHVGTDGTVETVEPVDAKGLSPQLITCLVGRASSHQFPELPKPTVVAVPLVFEP